MWEHTILFKKKYQHLFVMVFLLGVCLFLFSHCASLPSEPGENYLHEKSKFAIYLRISSVADATCSGRLIASHQHVGMAPRKTGRCTNTVPS